MSGNWPEGYFVYIPYTVGYYRELAPSYLRFCLLLKGILPTPATNFRYCELAMGNGYSANIHAAANDGIFVGLDFMPQHALFAQRIAREAKSGLTIHDADIADFCSSDRNEYDYICLHGGWSWISGESRKVIVEFIKRCLKPGGVFYVSYNSWPGWSSAAPLRKLFTLFDKFYGSSGMPAAERIGNAIGLTGALLECGPLFINASDWIKEHYERIKKENPAYLAHEFFNTEWNVEWFSVLAEKLWEAKLVFGASANICDNIPAFGLTEDARHFLESIANTVLREQIRDFFCNTQFRADIFIKGILELNRDEHCELLGKERFILSKCPDDFQDTIKCGMGIYELDRNLHHRLLNILASDSFAPKTLKAVHEKTCDMADLFQIAYAMSRLVATGYVQPCKPVIDRQDECARLNSLILKMGESASLEYLASPASGSGVHLPHDALSHLRNTLSKHKTADDSEALRHVSTSFNSELIPLLRAHGILPAQHEEKDIS